MKATEERGVLASVLSIQRRFTIWRERPLVTLISIDNKQLTKRIGVLPDELMDLVKENIQIVLDLE